jgi:hypothetical protein
MINSSKELVILDESLIKPVLASYREILIKRASEAGLKQVAYVDTMNKAHLELRAFEHYLKEILDNISIDKLRELYRLHLSGINVNDFKAEAESYLNVKFHHKFNHVYLRKAIFGMFEFFWENKVLLLTSERRYSMKKGINLDTHKTLPDLPVASELFNEITTLYTKQEKILSHTNYKQALVTRRSCLSYIMTTDWYSWGDVDLEEFFCTIREEDIKATDFDGWPSFLFKTALKYGNENYTQKDFENVFDNAVSFVQRLSSSIKVDSLELLDKYIKGHVELVNGTKFKVDAERNKPVLKSPSGVRKMGIISSDPEALDVPQRLYHYSNPYDPINYLKTLCKFRKNHETLNYLNANFYPGINTHPNEEFPEWCYAFRKFFAYSDNFKLSLRNRCRASIGRLADYLFIYLNQYYKLNDDVVGELPVSINQFKRIWFWENSILPEHEKKIAPMTLKEYLLKTVAVTTPAMLSLDDFFKFIKSNYSDKELIPKGAPDCSNFKHIFDYKFESKNMARKDNNVKGEYKKRVKGTDKIAMPLRTLPFVLNLFKALSDSLDELQQKIIELPIEERKKLKASHDLNANDIRWNCVEWGIDCSFVLDDKTITIESLPNFFGWGQTLDLGDIPTLSCFRMLRTNLHAGQRMENIQWLDIDDFDMFGKVEGYLQLLHITVDKVEDTRDCEIPHFIYELLQKEKEFQTIYNNANNEKILPTNSDKPTNPLFRYLNSDRPISDTRYFSMWFDLMRLLDIKYNESVPDDKQHSFIKLSPRLDSTRQPKCWNYGEPFVDSEGVERPGNASELVYRSVHTPHSMRNTYTVAHELFMTTQELMKQQGWSAEKTKHHYARAKHFDDRSEALERGEQALMSGKLPYMKDGKISDLLLSGKGAVRPSESESTMRKGLKNDNVNDFIHDQSMISITSPLMGEYQGESGIAKLINQRGIEPVVFDHCICPAGGDCPAEVVAIIKERHRCGICPVACCGIDNISGLGARISKKQSDAEVGIKQLQRMKSSTANIHIIKQMKGQIRLNQLEVASMRMTRNILEKKMLSENNNGYLSRRPDMVGDTVRMTIETSSQKGAFISNLIEAKSHPEYCSDNYLHTCERLARKLRNDDTKEEIVDPIGVVAGHISGLLRLKNIEIKALIQSEGFSRILKE